MKAKRIVAVLAGAALATGMAVGMTACKDKEKEPEVKAPEKLGTATLNISDYAGEYKPYSYNNYSQKGYKSITTLLNVDGADRISSNGDLIVYAKNSKFNVYSLSLAKDVLSNLDDQPQLDSVSIYGQGGQLSVITVTDSDSKTAYYMADGSQLFAKDAYVQVMASKGEAYIGTDTEAKDFLAVVGIKLDAATLETTQAFKYFKIEVDEETGAESYVSVSESDIKLFSPEYNKGEVIDSLTRPLYTSTEEKPVAGDMKDYSLKIDGNTYEFYKNGEKTGSMNLMDKRVLGFVDNYMYYYSLDYVDANATEGYNFVTLLESGMVVKEDYQLYKYDIKENTTTELNCDVAITEFDAMYNYTTKTYDAVYVGGFEMIDGVAYGDYRDVTYVTDKDMNVAFDLSGYRLSYSAPQIYKLGNDKYLTRVSGNNVIVDANLKVINVVDNTGYISEGLVPVSLSGGLIGFTDLTGKVVLEPKYSAGGNVVFYDGIANVYEASITDEGKNLLIKNDGTVVVNLTELEKSTDENVEKEVEVRDGYYTLTTVTTDENTGDETVTKSYYTFGGTLLKTFTLGQYDNVNTTMLDDGSLLITVIKYDIANSTQSYEYYKLVK